MHVDNFVSSRTKPRTEFGEGEREKIHNSANLFASDIIINSATIDQTAYFHSRARSLPAYSSRLICLYDALTFSLLRLKYLLAGPSQWTGLRPCLA